MLPASKWLGPALLAAPLFVSTNADDLVLLDRRPAPAVFAGLAGWFAGWRSGAQKRYRADRQRDTFNRCGKVPAAELR